MFWCNNSVTNIKKGLFGPHRTWPDTVTAATNVRIYLLTAAITTNANYIAFKSLIPYLVETQKIILLSSNSNIPTQKSR